MASGTGSFSAVMEITDSMRQSRKMDYAFLLAVFWTLLLVIPHTTAVVLAYPHQALTQGDGHVRARFCCLILHTVGVQPSKANGKECIQSMVAVTNHACRR